MERILLLLWIAAINMEWLVDYLEKNISEIKGDYICVSNVHTTVFTCKFCVCIG